MNALADSPSVGWRRPAAHVALAGALLGLSLLYVLRVPALAIPMTTLTTALRATAGALAWGVACLGTGALLMQRVLRVTPDEDIGWIEAIVMGMGVWGLLSLPWATLVGLTPGASAALLLLMSASWLARPRLPRPARPSAAGWLALLFLLPAALAILAPVTDTDEIYYHLALPRQLLETGRLLGGIFHPNGSRPLALHLPWAGLMAIGGEYAPRFFHLALVAGLLLVVHLRARKWWGRGAGALAPLLLVGSTSFLKEAGLAYNDIPAALCALIAVDSAMRPGRIRLTAVAAGAAMAIKYTAVFTLAPLFILLLLAPPWTDDATHTAPAPDRARHVRQVLLAGLLMTAIVAPWWIRNLLDGLHPLFPYAGWGASGDFAFQFPEKYGLGRGPLDLLLLPWNLIFRSETDSFVFLGRLHPALLGLLPLALLRPTCLRARWLTAISVLGLLAWASGTQLIRYLLPLLPVMALASASVVRIRPLHVGAWGLWVAGLTANLAPVLSDMSQVIPASLGWQEPRSYLEEHVTAWPCIEYMNQHTPSDAKVALLFTWQAWPLERSWLLGSVEDHIPSRFLIHRYGASALSTLQGMGVTHVMVQRIRFLQKQYPFLDATTFEQQFRQPEQDLERLLTAEAELVFEDGRFSIWAL